MLFSNADLDGIVAGEIDLAFRTWKRRMHAPGGRQRTARGVIGFGAVEVVDVDRITEAEARRAGTDLAALAETIAASIGREKRPFKAEVRRLKELGLTESLPAGHRLSPRGEAVLAHLRNSVADAPA